MVSVRIIFLISDFRWSLMGDKTKKNKKIILFNFFLTENYFFITKFQYIP